MQHSITIANTVTMTSLELVELVNEARAWFGESHVRHNDFVALCKNELDGEYYDVVVVKNQNGTTSEAIRMTQDQCKLVAMRGSKGVRRRLLARLNALEAARAAPALALPDFTNPAIAARAWADAIEATQALAIERDHAIATKAQIGSKREATAMATAATAKREAAKLKDQLGFSARHATILQVEDATGGDFGFLELRRWCKAHEVTPETVPDKRYPKGIKAWPAGAWMAVYNINLTRLFGEVVA